MSFDKKLEAIGISIHSPVWGETESCQKYLSKGKFQSTPPVWGETREEIRGVKEVAHISIHSPVWGRPAMPPS